MFNFVNKFLRLKYYALFLIMLCGVINNISAAMDAENIRRMLQGITNAVDTMGKNSIDHKAAVDAQTEELKKSNKIKQDRIDHDDEQQVLNRNEQAKARKAAKKIEEIKLTNAQALEKTKQDNATALAAETANQTIRANNARFENIQNVFKFLGNGLLNFVSTPSDLGKVLLAIVLVLAAFYGVPLAARHLNRKLKTPSVVMRTSLRSWFDSSPEWEPSSPLEGLIFEQEVQDRLDYIVDMIKTSVEDGDPLANILLYGPPGTGKTAFVEALAYYLDMDYVLISASELLKLKNPDTAVLTLQNIFNLAASSEKNVLVAIDECDAIFIDRTLPMVTQVQTALTNAFLAANPKPTNDKIMYAFLTNTAYKLDPAIMSRIGERVEIKLPGQPQREMLLEKYLDQFGQEHDVTLSPNISLTELAKSLEGISPREIEYISAKMVQMAKRISAGMGYDSGGVLTMNVAKIVEEQMKKSIQQANAWELERQKWSNNCIAVSK